MTDSPSLSTPSAGEAASNDTKEQLLDAAELLIGRHGIDGTSVRAITEAAGANLAAVSYHFGSKEGLVRAVFARRLGPINHERLALLERCLASPGGASVECVVRAFVKPPFHVLHDRSAPHFGRCMIRALSDPGPQMKEMMTEAFEELIDRFAAALTQVLPQADPEEVYWRFHFMVGSMAYTVGMGHLVEEYSRGLCTCDDFEGIGERLVRFVAAGMRAATQEETP